MPVRESEAIVLRTYALGEGDRLVSFLSRAEGRMRGVARGARRPKSRFGSALEPLSHIRIWYYERETRPLARISQCELVESFLSAQGSYEASLAFGLIAEIAENTLPERETSDPMFRLVLATCRAIRDTGQIALPLAYYALWTVRLGGWLPSLERCAGCGRELDVGPAWAGGEGGGIYCRDCRPGDGKAISMHALHAALPMLRTPVEKLAAVDNARAPAELMSYLLDRIEEHTEKKLHVRSMLETATRI